MYPNPAVVCLQGFWFNFKSHVEQIVVNLMTNLSYFSQILTLFHMGSGMTLSHEGGSFWPTLTFSLKSQWKVMPTSKTCSQIRFLIFRHPLVPLFQQSRKSDLPFLSVKVNHCLCIETSKIGKTPKGPPLWNEKKNCLRFHSNFLCETLWP